MASNTNTHTYTYAIESINNKTRKFINKMSIIIIIMEFINICIAATHFILEKLVDVSTLDT